MSGHYLPSKTQKRYATDKPDPLYASVHLDGKQVSMEIDTGSAVSIMSESKSNFIRTLTRVTG